MTSAEFTRELARLSAAYDKDFSDAMAEVYFEALGDCHPHDLTAAVGWAIKTLKFLPKPSELLDRAKYERPTRVEAERKAELWALRALPVVAPRVPLPLPPDITPEWVTEGTDVHQLVKNLQTVLTDADRTVEALRPPQVTQPNGAPIMTPEERMARAQRMLADFAAHNAKREQP